MPKPAKTPGTIAFSATIEPGESTGSAGFVAFPRDLKAAKHAGTRQRRVEKAVAMLAEGKPLKRAAGSRFVGARPHSESPPVCFALAGAPSG